MVTNFKERNQKIKNLRFKRQWIYKAIAEKFDITSERVRQICSKRIVNEDLLLKVANAYIRKFEGEKIGAKELLEDIAIFAKKDRKKSTVIKRNALIVYLYDELNFSFPSIGKLLNRDHTTIVHSYQTHKKQQNG